MTEPRAVTAARVEEDAQYEAGLRPRMLDEYIGQETRRKAVKLTIENMTYLLKQVGDKVEDVRALLAKLR